MQLASNHILDNNEPLIGLAAAVRKHGAHPGTGARWIMKGCRSTSGERIHLEAVRRGYKWVTSAEAVERFFARLSPPAASTAPVTPAPVTTPTDRRRAAEAAARELESAGA